uniref:Putative cuticle protein n=1 Tax=Ixodes ricinus TaxID=34613 RepID=A0A0K8RHF3_IXORI
MILKVLLLYAVTVVAVEGRAVENNAEDNEKSPYSIHYDHTDEFGTRIYSLEITDADNVRMGTYGYMDAKGLYRQVHYLADSTGYHVYVCTNEPGTETSYPGDAVIHMHHWEKVDPDSTLGKLLSKLPPIHNHPKPVKPKRKKKKHSLKDTTKP